MSLSLDDLGRAAWEAEWRAVLAAFGSDTKPPPYTDIDSPSPRAGALAAVERFAEEACKGICIRCRDDVHVKVMANGNWMHVDAGGLHACYSTGIRSLLSSLRDEAGQKGGAT